MVNTTAFVAICLAICLHGWAPPSAAAELAVTFFDVGQGDAILLHEPGSCTILIDTGPADQAEALIRRMRAGGVTRLDHLLLTHSHADHTGGAIEVAQAFAPKMVHDNGGLGRPVPEDADYPAVRRRLRPEARRAGDRIDCGGLVLDVLHPSPTGSSSLSINEASLVVMADYQHTRILLTGDLSGVGEERLLAGGDELSAAILKAGHHGAGDGTSAQLLAMVRPDLVVISSTRVNRIGAPAAEVLARIAALGIDTLITFRAGDIGLTVSQAGWRLATP